MDAFDTPPSPVLLEATPHKMPDGTPLAPYSFGRRLVYKSFFESEAEPVTQMFTLALLFTLTRSESEARAMLFDNRGARDKLLKWIEETVKDPVDYPPLRKLANAIVEEAERGRVEQEPTRTDGLEKKT